MYLLQSVCRSKHGNSEPFADPGEICNIMGDNSFRPAVDRGFQDHLTSYGMYSCTPFAMHARYSWLLWLKGEELQVDGIAHGFVTGIVWMQVVAGVNGW